MLFKNKKVLYKNLINKILKFFYNKIKKILIYINLKVIHFFYLAFKINITDSDAYSDYGKLCKYVIIKRIYERILKLLIKLFIKLLINKLINKLIKRLKKRLINRILKQLIKLLIKRLIDRFINRKIINLLKIVNNK